MHEGNNEPAIKKISPDEIEALEYIQSNEHLKNIINELYSHGYNLYYKPRNDLYSMGSCSNDTEKFTVMINGTEFYYLAIFLFPPVNIYSPPASKKIYYYEYKLDTEKLISALNL
jgi:hypothetical protein